MTLHSASTEGVPDALRLIRHKEAQGSRHRASNSHPLNMFLGKTRTGPTPVRQFISCLSIFPTRAGLLPSGAMTAAGVVVCRLPSSDDAGRNFSYRFPTHSFGSCRPAHTRTMTGERLNVAQEKLGVQSSDYR